MSKKICERDPNTPKKAAAFSFAGKKGYKALEVLETITKLNINKSKIVVDLILMYNDVASTYGYDDAAFEMRYAIRRYLEESKNTRE